MNRRDRRAAARKPQTASTVRLFRQTATRDYASVPGRARVELLKLAAAAEPDAVVKHLLWHALRTRLWQCPKGANRRHVSLHDQDRTVGELYNSISPAAYQPVVER
jgi:hypothetical protein